MTLRAGSGAQEGQARSIAVDPSTLLGACITDARARISRDPESDTAALLSQDRAEMMLPLVSRAQVIGAIAVRSAPGDGFGDEDVRTLQTLADQIANAMENARLFDEERQTEQELKRERNLLRTLIDHIPDYIYVKDGSSRFVTANKAVASIMGAASPEDVTGKTDFDYYDAALAEKYRGDERAVLEQGTPLINMEEFAVDTGGAIHWNLTTKVPLRDETGKITGMVGVGRDITKIKEVEESLREQTKRLQIALEVAGVVTSLLDVGRFFPGWWS